MSGRDQSSADARVALSPDVPVPVPQHGYGIGVNREDDGMMRVKRKTVRKELEGSTERTNLVLHNHHQPCTQTRVVYAARGMK